MYIEQQLIRNGENKMSEITVEFEDGWAVEVKWDGAWVITNTSGSKVATLEKEDITNILDQLGLKIVSK